MRRSCCPPLLLYRQQLSEALDEFAGKGGWKVNPGDGAFYGPKIDIKVMTHYCACGTPCSHNTHRPLTARHEAAVSQSRVVSV